MDIKESIAAMHYINDLTGHHYKIIEELDLIRTGGDTGKQPEARFIDVVTNETAVIEIKNFPFESNEEKAGLLYTRPKLLQWIQEFHQAHANADTRIVFEILIKKPSINPILALQDLKQGDLFAGISNKFLDLKASKWHRSKPYFQISDFRMHFDEHPGSFVVVEEALDPIDINAAITETINYERYVDLLHKEWTVKKWDDKFKHARYKDDSKYLYLKIGMGYPHDFAIANGQFTIQKFGDTLLRKYGSTQSLRQLRGILFFAERHYQLLEQVEGEFRWKPLLKLDNSFTLQE
ncbi:hypothetical protein ACFOHW_25400 [Paenibacillus abyssi]|uniref:hypothetical protein n=1 Tax=Paenibacillus abyssi TaxID=1340531 RepID=UPI0036135C0F